jgi:hypothetical protein
MKFTVVHKGFSGIFEKVLSFSKNSIAEFLYNSLDKIALPVFLSQLIILKFQ